MTIVWPLVLVVHPGNELIRPDPQSGCDDKRQRSQVDRACEIASLDEVRSENRDQAKACGDSDLSAHPPQKLNGGAT